MSNERNDDDTVSRRYRDLATEHTPQHLDEAVLARAAAAAEPRYARSIRWTRPLAWAATITLCLALTLQFADLPTPQGVVSPKQPAGILKQEQPAPGRRQDAALDSRASAERQADAKTEQRSGAASAADRAVTITGQFESSDNAISGPKDDAAAAPGAWLQVGEQQREVVDQARDMVRARNQAAPESSAPPEPAAMPAPTAPAAVDTRALSAAAPGNAEADARRAAKAVNREAEKAAASFAEYMNEHTAEQELLDDDAANDCDTDARATPEDWAACIDALREAGQHAAAERERDLLEAAYPARPEP